MVNGFTDAFIQGSQIAPALEEQRRERRAARAADRRNAAAFNALSEGDITRTAAFNPQLARQAQLVQTGEQEQKAAQAQRQRNLAVDFTRAFRQSVARGVPPEQAISQIVPVFSRFEDPDSVAEFGQVLLSNPSAAESIEAALQEPVRRGSPAKPLEAIDAQGNRVFIERAPDDSFRAVEGFSPVPETRKTDPLTTATRQENLRRLRRRNDEAQQEAAQEDGDSFTFEFSAEAKNRAALGLPGVIAANDTLEKLFSEGVRLGGNTRDQAANVARAVPFDGGFVERLVGSEDRNRLVQASSTIESTLLPIFSGAAVTIPEAQRLIRAALPQPGDGDAVLIAKQKQRRFFEEILRAGVSGSAIDVDQLVANGNAIEKALLAQQENGTRTAQNESVGGQGVISLDEFLAGGQ